MRAGNGHASSDLTGRIGVVAVQKIFLEQFSWSFREQSVSDYGIDAQVEVVEEGYPTGKLFALQIKSGPSYFSRKKGDNYIYRGTPRHLTYWTNHSLPVFIVLHNPLDGMTLWQKIERRLITRTKKRWSIPIPASNFLNERAKKFFEAGIAADPEANRRFQFSVDLKHMSVSLSIQMFT